MAYRRIELEVIEEIEHLLGTTDLSCRQIAEETGVTRGVVDRLHAKGMSGAPRASTSLYRRCGCGAKSRPIGKDACLACEIRRRQCQGTPAGDVSLGLDLADEHQARYEEVQKLARIRFEARDKKPESG